MKSVKYGAIGLAVIGLLSLLWVIKVPDSKAPPTKPHQEERIVPDVGVPGYSPGVEDRTDDTTPAKRRVKVLTLTKDNTVELTGGVTYLSVLRTQEKLKAAIAKNPERIYLLITSPGGEVISGAQLLATIEGSPIPIDTVCVALCASMGAQIHAVGSQRYMTDKSLLMFHPASGGVQGEFDTVISQLNFLNRYVNKMDAYVARRAGIPYEVFKARTRNEYWMDSEEATDSNFNDRIVYLDDEREAEPLSIFGGTDLKKDKVESPASTFFKGL